MSAGTKQELGPNQRKWIAALRSGEHKQGTSGLYNRRDDTKCCLGVGCLLFDLRQKECPFSELVKFGDRGDTAYAPEELIEILALRGAAGTFRGRAINGKDSLAAANDSGETFAEIADFIEANPEAVFTEAR